jgi:hypothetical protein
LTTRCGSSGSTASRRAAAGFLCPALLALALAAASGCSSPSRESDEEPERESPAGEGGGGTALEASALFVVDPSEPSLVDFETNDDAYISDRGYTLWALKARSQSPFVARTAVLNKRSGSAEAGYGLVFCHHEADERMLVAMIDMQQEYIVGEAVGSRFTAIVPWTASAFLKKGCNQDNEIGLRLDAESRVFTLSLNGVDVKSFSAIEPEYELDGGNGYLVVVSPWDVFPRTPVRVAFLEK